jgi:hypothetical protein
MSKKDPDPSDRSLKQPFDFGKAPVRTLTVRVLAVKDSFLSELTACTDQHRDWD